MKGQALRRALSVDPLRVNASVPLIVDRTELITPTLAKEMLKRNHHNRPINWRKVEEYAQIMRDGGWQLHGQGIILDTEENILTGQKRLWAIVLSDTAVYMRVSRGNPASVARLLDRGDPQSARDLAARDTGQRHRPVEVSVARGLLALLGNFRPSTDLVADTIASNAPLMEAITRELTGTRKTRSILMVVAAICFIEREPEMAAEASRHAGDLAEQLDMALLPHTSSQCWGRGAAFGLALEKAMRLVESWRVANPGLAQARES